MIPNIRNIFEDLYKLSFVSYMIILYGGNVIELSSYIYVEQLVIQSMNILLCMFGKINVYRNSQNYKELTLTMENSLEYSWRDHP